MIPRRFPGLCAAMLGLSLTGLGAPAAADGPRVRITPDVAEGAPKWVSATPDRLLPASTEFTMELRLGDVHISPTSDASGAVRIWPSAEKDCGQAPPSGDTPQSYRLSMSLSGQGADRVLTATVPPLQVGQEFCFKVEVRAGLGDSELRDVAQLAAQQLSTELAPPDGSSSAESCLSAAKVEDFARALKTAIGDNGYKADLSDAAQIALNQFRAGASAACSAARAAASSLRADAANLREAEGQLEAAYRRLRTEVQPPAGLSEPVVVVDDKGTVRLASTLLDASSKLDALQGAAAQLAARADADHPKMAEWSGLLEGLRVAFEQAGGDEQAAPKRAAAVADARKQAEALRKTTALPLDIPAGKPGAFLTASGYLANPDVVHPDVVLASLDAQAAAVPPKERTKLDALRSAVSNLIGKTRKRDEALSTKGASTDRYNSAYVTFEGALATAFSGDTVRQRISVAVVTVSARDKAGVGKTPDKGNYAAIDIGVMVAVPSGGDSFEAWVMPYVGLNLYSIPVDRTIAVSELTGSAGEKLRQRVSLTVGTTLTAPELTGRKVNKPIGVGNYPLAALGVRMTQYMRLTAGAVFYDLSAKNPASAAHALRAAPFLSASLDADVAQLFTERLR